LPKRENGTSEFRLMPIVGKMERAEPVGMIEAGIQGEML
jgi:hypothetical protein